MLIVRLLRLLGLWGFFDFANAGTWAPSVECERYSIRAFAKSWVISITYYTYPYRYEIMKNNEFDCMSIVYHD